MPTLEIVGLINGDPTEYDGKFLVDYDPTPQTDESGEFVHLIVTDRQRDARWFATKAEAVALWESASTKGPRPDGEPDRPLTAYSVRIHP